MKHKTYDFRTAFIDVLLNILTSIVFLFMIATFLITPQKASQSEGIKKNAEFVATIEWNPDIDCDVDIWARDPANRIANFQNTSNGGMHIERDDMGFAADRLIQFGTSRIIRDNSETLVLRDFTPGKYTINVHVYACRVSGTKVPIGEPLLIDVDISLTKLNPSIRVITKETLKFSKVWEEQTAFSFVIKEDGTVIDLADDQVTMVKVQTP